jgi:hypothetical protein
VGVPYHPSGCLGRPVTEAKLVDGRGLVAAGRAPLLPQHDAFGLEGGEGLAQGRAIADAAALVQDASRSRGDAVEELIEGNWIPVFLEAEGAPDDVEQRFEFGLAEAGEKLVEDQVGHRGGRGMIKSGELKIDRIALSPHSVVC